MEDDGEIAVVPLVFSAIAPMPLSMVALETSLVDHESFADAPAVMEDADAVSAQVGMGAAGAGFATGTGGMITTGGGGNPPEQHGGAIISARTFGGVTRPVRNAIDTPSVSVAITPSTPIVIGVGSFSLVVLCFFICRMRECVRYAEHTLNYFPGST